MRTILYDVGAAFFALLALASLWGAITGARKRSWKFAGAGLILMLVFSLCALQIYAKSQGSRYAPDSGELRMR
jgi:hypothetical protein